MGTDHGFLVLSGCSALAQIALRIAGYRPAIACITDNIVIFKGQISIRGRISSRSALHPRVAQCQQEDAFVQPAQATFLKARLLRKYVQLR